STYSYLPGGPVSPVMTAEALLGRQYLGWSRDNPALRQGAAFVAADLESAGTRNIYYWYYATQMLHNMRNKDWERWNLIMRETLVHTQIVRAACDRGSWDPLDPNAADRHTLIGGRLYLTSLSLLTLEVYYRFLPLYRDPEGGTTTKDAELAANVQDEEPGIKAASATKEKPKEEKKPGK